MILDQVRRRGATSGVTNPAAWLSDALGGAPSVSGVRVNPKKSLESTAVWDCVKILSEDIGSLPLITYRRLRPRGKDRASDHPLFGLLRLQPNPEMTAFGFWETVVGHLALWGNAFAEIEFNNGGVPIGLWPLLPDRTRVIRKDGAKLVLTRLADSTTAVLPAERVLHVPGFGFNGLTGFSPIALHRMSIGLSLASDEFAARFYGSGSSPSGVLTYQGQLDDESFEKLKADWVDMHEGLSNAHRVAILENGVGWEQIGISPRDSQFIEGRKFSVLEIARIFRMPPHKLGELERAIQANIESQQISYVTDTLRPWLVKIEQTILTQLFSEKDRQTFFPEFLVEAILRGDTETRFKAYSVGRQWGWLSANDVLEKENSNPLPGDQGDLYMVPLNMIPASQIGAGLARAADGRQSSRDADPLVEVRAQRSVILRHRLQVSHVPVFRATAARLMSREVRAARRALKAAFSSRGENDFRQWIEEFYPGHSERVFDAFRPLVSAYAELIRDAALEEIGEEELEVELDSLVEQYTRGLANRETRRSISELRQILRDDAADDLQALISERLDEWEADRPAASARRETVQAGGFIALSTYAAAGRRKLVWVTVGRNCPLCDSLDGKVVGIEANFLEPGEVLDSGTEEGGTFTADIGIRHPPLHGRGGKGGVCDCLIAAG